MRFFKYKIIGLFALALVISSCASGKVDSGQKSDIKYEQVAQRKLKGTIEYIKNSTGDYVLCTKTTNEGVRNLEFLVYDIKNDKISFDLKVGNGSVAWFDATHVQVTQVPGVIPQGFEMADYTTLYNVIDGSSRPKKSK